MGFPPCKTHDEAGTLFPHTPTPIVYHIYAFMQENANGRLGFLSCNVLHVKNRGREVHETRSSKGTFDVVSKENADILSLVLFVIEGQKTTKRQGFSFLQLCRRRCLRPAARKLVRRCLRPMKNCRHFCQAQNTYPLMSFFREKSAGDSSDREGGALAHMSMIVKSLGKDSS